MKIADQKSAGQAELTQAEQGVEEHTEKHMAKRCWLIIGGILAAAICFIALIEYFYPIQLL